MVGAHSGAAFASADSIDITVQGRGGHGSRPETTIDPIVIASSIVGRLQTIVSREIAPKETAVVTVGRLNAGTKNNIIPDSAELGLTIRSYSEDVRERMLAAIERIVSAEAAASGAPDPVIVRAESFPVTVNGDNATERTMVAFRSAFGDDTVFDPGRSREARMSVCSLLLRVRRWSTGFSGVRTRQRIGPLRRQGASTAISHRTTRPISLRKFNRHLTVGSLPW